MELPKIQPNLMSMLTEFRDLYGFDPMQQSWEEHLRGDAIDQDQVCDMMTTERTYDETCFFCEKYTKCTEVFVDDEKEELSHVMICSKCKLIKDLKKDGVYVL